MNSLRHCSKNESQLVGKGIERMRATARRIVLFLFALIVGGIAGFIADIVLSNAGFSSKDSVIGGLLVFAFVVLVFYRAINVRIRR